MERFLTVSDVANVMRLSERKVRALIAAGRLLVVRPEGLRVVRIPESEVTRFMQTQTPAEKATAGT